MIPIDYQPKNKKNLIPLLTPAIDSLSLIIPVDKVTFVDPKVKSKINIYYCDSDEFHTDCEDELLPPRPTIISENGINIRLGITNRFVNGTSTEVLTITFSAKLLKERYFQGFQLYNIEIAYQTLMSFNKVYFPLETMLNGLVADIDICYNFRMPKELFPKLVNYYNGILKQGKASFFNPIKPHKNVYSEDTNLGLMINERKKATPPHPFAKYYCKELESQTEKFQPFFDKYLHKLMLDWTDLFRFEYTIKNAKHKKRLIKKGLLKTAYSTLNELLHVSKVELKNIALSVHQDYFNISDTVAPTSRIYKKFSPQDNLILHLLNHYILNGGSYVQILDDVVFKYTKTERARLKSKVTKLYEHLTTEKHTFQTIAEENETLYNVASHFLQTK